MKKYLLPKEGKFYKANMHCHSTMSDGKWTPEEIKERFMAEGYSIVAYTDHNLMFAHPELRDDSFLPLTGYEWDVCEVLTPEEKQKRSARLCHICVVAPTETGTPQVGFHRTKHASKAEDLRHLVEFDENEPDFEREFSMDCINRFTKKAQELGYFVTYNHPTWSCDTYDQYMAYENFDAMEMMTYASVAEGWDDYNPRVYDDMLRGGKRLYCVGADDNHNWSDDCFGGFTMIRSEKLDYESIFAALKRGDCYASEGPEIHELYLETEGEDTYLCVKSSEAQHIMLTTGRREAGMVMAKDGVFVTEARFKIKKKYNYVRVTVTAPDGKHATSRAYFTDEVM